MIDEIISKTQSYIDNKPKSSRKKIGQFFTSKETALFMANMFNFNLFGSSIKILDPGAGTGILTAAFVEVASQKKHIHDVDITCYENNPDVLPILKNTLLYLKNNAPINIRYRIITDDYILSQANAFEHHTDVSKYDAVIGNPPYMQVMRASSYAESMSSVVHGAPNMYFLFAAMSLYNLNDNSEMVYIIPRSWTSGEYFKAFREFFLNEGKLVQIHLFVSRDKVFSQEEVLQETIIIKIKRTNISLQNVLITSSNSNNDFDEITTIFVPYELVVVGKNKYVFLPTSVQEIATIRTINLYSKNLNDEGYRMRTGIVVDFRQRDDLRAAPGIGIVPLFYSQHINNGRVHHNESGKDYDWITDEKKGLIQPNENYVFCKRFTAKEERRRLQCGIYLAEEFSEYKVIGTQNKINYVNRIDNVPLSIEETYGLYALLNSSLFEQYYRILNGSTQVNSTEINNIPVPNQATIIQIGKTLLLSGDLSVENCDRIIMEEAYNEQIR